MAFLDFPLDSFETALVELSPVAFRELALDSGLAPGFEGPTAAADIQVSHFNAVKA